MKKRAVIGLLCILLIVSLPVVVAQQNSAFSAQSDYDASQQFNAAQTNTPASFLDQPSLLSERLLHASSTFVGNPQDVGEALIVYADTPQPPIIRASALEDQSMTVYIPLRATDLGSLLSPITNDPSERDPLTGLTNFPTIRSMNVRLNKTNPFVNTVKHIPPRPGYTKDNLGYLVVVLNKLRNETTLPTINEEGNQLPYGVNASLPVDVAKPVADALGSDTPVINLDLTAEIQFDLETAGVLNLGEQDLVLRPESDSQFLAKIDKEENSFFNKRAYVRASEITSERVKLVIYNKDLLPISIFSPPNAPAGLAVASVDLSKTTPVSRPVRLGISENPLKDTVYFVLDEIVLPNDRATYQLTVGGKTYERKANVNSFLYPRSKWQIMDIEYDTENIRAIDVLNGGFNLNLEMKERVRNTAEPLTLVTHTLTLRNVLTGDTRTLVRESISGETLTFDVPPMDDQSASFLEQKYCPQNNLDYACVSINRFRKLMQQYPNTVEAREAYKQLFEIYDKALIDYEACDLTSQERNEVKDAVSCEVFLSDMERLAYYYADKIKDTNPELIEKLKEGFGGKGGLDYLQDEGISVQLRSVEEITAQQKGTVTLTGGTELRVDDPLPVGEGVTTNGEKFIYKIVDIKPNTISVRREKTSAISSVVGIKPYLDLFPKTLVIGRNTLVIKETKTSDGRTETETVNIEIAKIDTQTEAAITIVPGTGRGLSRSAFKVHIPIESRPFPHLGEKLKDQINATRELVKKLDNVINKLDKLVRTWKKICLVTFAAITLKSSFLGGTTRTLARRGVSEIYKKDCQEQVLANKAFTSVDACLAARSDEIKKDVDANERAIESVQSQLEGKTLNTLKTCGDVPFQTVRALGATVEDCQEYLRLNALKGTGSETIQKAVQQDLGKLNFEAKRETYNQAKLRYESDKEEWQEYFGGEDAEEQAILFNAQKIEEEKTQTSLREDLVPLRTVRVIPDTNQIVTPTSTGQPLKLTKVTRLQRMIYDGDIGEITKIIDNKRMSDDAKELAIATNFNVPDPANMYVEEKYQGTPTNLNLGIANQGHAAFIQRVIQQQNLPLLVTTDNTRAVMTKNSAKPAEFKLYSSQVVETANQLRSLDYAYVQGGRNAGALIAQYDADSGRPVCYPVGTRGEYVLVLERFQGNGLVKSFRVLNVGANGVIDCGGGDDALVLDESALALPANEQQRRFYLGKVENAPQCTDDGTKVGSVTTSTGRTVPVECSLQQSRLNLDTNNLKCIDVMEPEDCKVLFNVCDPVMCPSTRCNLGGKYKVDDVIQSGIVGSIALCLPNYEQGVVVPVCLTGILAGLKNIRSILQSYSDCLEANLNDGKNVGFCDYIRSVGICEMVWRETVNLLNIRGGVIDYLSDEVFGQPEGGAEYLTFQQSLANVGDSFDYFTTEYSNTYIAALKGSSTEEIGSQICRLGVYGKLPNVGEVLDKLSEPEDPPQFFAFFDEVPYVENIGESPLTRNALRSTQELSLYKVFYHIYAGTGFAQDQNVLPFSETLNPATGELNKAVSFTVILRNSEAGLPDLYMTNEGDFVAQSAVVQRGQYAQKTVQKVAPTGYNEICINLNGKEECGFRKVTSSFSLNYLNDEIVNADARETIDSAEECVPDAPSTSPALGSFTTPENYGLVSTGITRVCNPTPPTADTARWANVGTCGKDPQGIDRGTCWLDRNSININNAQTRNDLLIKLQQQDKLGKNPQQLDILTEEQSLGKLSLYNQDRNRIVLELKADVEQRLREGVQSELPFAVGTSVARVPEEGVRYYTAPDLAQFTDDNVILEGTYNILDQRNGFVRLDIPNKQVWVPEKDVILQATNAERVA